jgi:hypothetical protein
MGRHRERRTSIGGQFAPRLIEMLECPAFRALSLSARRILDRVEIEMAQHGGTDNGRLPVTYADFEAYGIHRHAIGPAIREAAALGFLQVTERGRAGNAEFRSPNYFRLTYRHSKDSAGDGSHEWRRIESMTQAIEIASEARRRRANVTSRSRKKQKASAGKRHVSVTENGTENRKAPVPETDTTVMVRKPPLLSISRGGSRSAPTQGAVASEPPQNYLIESLIRVRGCNRAEADDVLASLPDARPPTQREGQ